MEWCLCLVRGERSWDLKLNLNLKLNPKLSPNLNLNLKSESEAEAGVRGYLNINKTKKHAKVSRDKQLKIKTT